MTVFRIAPAVADAFPDTLVALVTAGGLKGREPWPDTTAALEDLERRLADGRWRPADETDPRIEAWHTAYRSFGTNPRRVRPSVDALGRRLAKKGSLPRINPAVDSYNTVSVRHGLPAGAFDLDHVAGDVDIRPRTARRSSPRSASPAPSRTRGPARSSTPTPTGSSPATGTTATPTAPGSRRTPPGSSSSSKPSTAPVTGICSGRRRRNCAACSPRTPTGPASATSHRTARSTPSRPRREPGARGLRGRQREASPGRPAARTSRPRGTAAASASRTRSPPTHRGPRFPAGVARAGAATRGPTVAPTLSAAVA